MTDETTKTVDTSRRVAKRLGEIAVAAVAAGEAFERYADACEAGRQAGPVGIPAMAFALADVQEKTEKLVALYEDLETDLETELQAMRGGG